MQKRITEKDQLLDEKGHLKHKGYATSLLLDYDRSKIKANKMRIKEWDYYLISNGKKALALTAADNSYMGMISASWIDLENKTETTNSLIDPLTMGKKHMPSSSKEGDTVYENSTGSLWFLHEDNERRHLQLLYPGFKDGKDLTADIITFDEPEDSMVIATPFADDPLAFYYNQKIVGMKARGRVTLGTKDYYFEKDSTTALLDWGRGVWTYDNTWYWSAASGYLNGHMFGFNLGYGFGDTSAASENMLFYDGKAHKLDRIQFQIPRRYSGKDDFMSVWKFTSNDGRFEMKFKPVLNRSAHMNYLVLESDQNQVFGNFTGTCTLDDGTVLEVKDFPGFAEKVHNRY